MNKNYSEKRIPRPPNAFMLFGQKYRRTVAQQYPSYTNKQISKILGDKWRKMDPAEKDSYHCLANEAHANHMKKYPGYYYSPLEARQRKAERKRKYMQKITLRRNNSDSSENVMGLPNITNTQFVQYNYNLMPTCCSSNPLDSLTISDPNGSDLNGYHGLFGDHCYAAFIEPDTSHHPHQPHPPPSAGPHHHIEFEQSQLQQQLLPYQPPSHLFDSQRPCQRSHGFPVHYIKEEPTTPITPTTPTPPTSTSSTPTITSANQNLCSLQLLPDQHQQLQLQPQPDLLDFEALDKLIGNANLDNWNFLVDFKF